MGNGDNPYRFAGRIRQLGPLWREVNGLYYECHTLVKRSSTCFIATTPLDHRLFRVDLATNAVTPILSTDVPCGEVTPLEHHVSVHTLVRLVAEAWLRDEAPGIEQYASYVIRAYTATRLVLTDELSEQLVARLDNESGTIGEISTYKSDGVGSPRLLTALIQGVVELVQAAVRRCPE